MHRVPDGEAVVRLSVPDNARFFPTSFSSDGGTLAAFSFGMGYVLTWDLHAIRRQLRSMGLDWDDTPIPDLPPGPFRYPESLVVAISARAHQPAQLPMASASAADPQTSWVVFSIVISLQPLHPVAYLRRAESLLAMNRFDEAYHDVEQAPILDPRSTAAYLLRGRIRRKRGDFGAAQDDFVRAVRLAPGRVESQMDRADNFSSDGAIAYSSNSPGDSEVNAQEFALVALVIDRPLVAERAVAFAAVGWAEAIAQTRQIKAVDD